MSFDSVRNKLRQMKQAAMVRQSVVDQLANTPVGKLAREISGVAKTRTATKSTADRLRRQFEMMTSGASRESVAKTSVARQIAEIEKYAANESGGAWGWMKRKFGPVADTIKSLLRPMGGSTQSRKEIEAAAELLNALGASTDGARGKRVSVETTDPRARASAEAVLRGLGFDVQPLGSRPAVQPERITPAEVPDEFSGTTRKSLAGGSVYFRPDDPILTGEMIPVSSSNVHSIGYIWDDKAPAQGTLKVRFLDTDQNGKKTTRGGPTYHYFGVHPRVFIAFQKAHSKGGYVWDRLRVRGTVSGHQYKYELMGLSSSGHVPRQATRVGNKEWFRKRTVTTTKGQKLTSQLADRMVRQLTRGQVRRLNQNINPNDGVPRNGRPGNGRP